jgi:hypothetical protein
MAAPSISAPSPALVVGAEWMVYAAWSKGGRPR